MFQKIVAAVKKSIDGLYHNWFLRLWLAFGGLIGISTISSCPCCGQPVCPTGVSLPIILGALLAGLGVFRKKIVGFFGPSEPVSCPRPAVRTRTRVLSWVLILLVVTAALRWGTGFLVKGAPKHRWQASRSVFLPSPVVPLQPRRVQTAVTEKASLGKPTRILENPIPRTESPARDVEKIIPHAPSVIVKQDAPKRERMSAVIGSKGAVEIKKEIPGLVRYETAGFLELNNDIYDRLDLYEGKKVEIQGFVYRRNDFKPDQFVAARLYMWCCAFDATPMGPLCQWDRASELEDGAWIKVHGTILKQYFKDTYGGESGNIPVIKVERVERTPKLESPYVYARGKSSPRQPPQQPPR